MMCQAKKILFGLFVWSAVGLTACSSGATPGGNNQTPEQHESGSDVSETSEEDNQDMVKNYDELFQGLKLSPNYKSLFEQNPIMTQRFGADPYAMVYGDRVYFYMTQDAFMYDAEGNVKENDYSNCRTISVVSTDDMINFTDHGQIQIAGPNGAAKWAKNSWAPAAAWKNIDGKDKFFLYFADGGGGIGVVTSDSPTGPFVDELGKGLIRRDMPNCGNVLWLFDPAVLVDDDGRAYIYFGGGVPQDRISDPGTGRVAELGDDMMSLKGEPVALDVPYLFEDSGIHKVNDTYYYTYCSNWQVDEAGTAKYGFKNAEIVSLESKSPMGPFTFKETILSNPGQLCGEYGNNHHAVFSFKGNWYITYHSRLMEKNMGVLHNYRCTHVVQFQMGEDGTIGRIPHKQEGREQLKYINPYEKVNATCVSSMAGANTVPADGETEKIGSGTFALKVVNTGDYVKIEGVDFGETAPKTISASVRGGSGDGVIQVKVGRLTGDVIGYLPITEGKADFTTFTAELTGEVTGVTDLFFVFYGEGYEIADWSFEK